MFIRRPPLLDKSIERKLIITSSLDSDIFLTLLTDLKFDNEILQFCQNYTDIHPRLNAKKIHTNKSLHHQYNLSPVSRPGKFNLQSVFKEKHTTSKQVHSRQV